MVDTSSTAVTGSGEAGTTLPLNLLDEALLHLQDARAQWNVQLELGTDHQLDQLAFRDALVACCRRHPLVRARLAPWKASDSAYRWELADRLDLNPVQVEDCPDTATVDRLREDLFSRPLELDTAPALRIILARRPGGDLVMLSVSHLIADGVGAVRLMQTLARAYRGEPDPPDPLPLAEARDLGAFLAPESRTEKWSRQLEVLRRIREAFDAPSRLAVAGGSDREGSGFVFRELDIGETTTPALVHRNSGTTVNDVLLAALHLTAAAWNDEHDEPAERVAVMMPVNVRPADRFWEVVSNLTSMVSVSTSPEDRADFATAVAAVSEQTEQVRREDRAHGLYDLLEATKKAPLAIKRQAPKLLPYTGDRFVDTVMLSNLGRVPEPPSFNADPDSGEPEMWFSPPCDPTCNVAIGIATRGQRLSLVTRYRYDQFDAAAAEAFTDLLISHFTSGDYDPGRGTQARQ